MYFNKQIVMIYFTHHAQTELYLYNQHVNQGISHIPNKQGHVHYFTTYNTCMEDYCDQLTNMIINSSPEYHTISTFKSQLCFFNAIGLNLTCPLWYCAEILEDSAALRFKCWLMKLQWKMYPNLRIPIMARLQKPQCRPSRKVHN